MPLIQARGALAALLLVIAHAPSMNAAESEPPTVVIRLADTEAQKVSTIRDVYPNVSSAVNDAQAQGSHDNGFISRARSWLSGSRQDRDETAPESSVAEPSATETWSDRVNNHDARRGNRHKAENAFDDYFRKYSKHYFGVVTDWRWFKAQAIVESELKPDARSRSGAMGLMQIMPRTFREIRSRNPQLADPYDPYFSIAAGIYYNRQLYDAWSSIDDPAQRRKFMFASYNAGLGAVKRSAKRAGNPMEYTQLEPHLSAAPRQYVLKIERERKKLER